MFEKCMANCMAEKIHLQLRNKTFYYRVELPRANNKRRYKIISLHTQNYFEAQERVKQMITLEEKFAHLQRLFNNLIFEDVVDTNIATVVSPFSKRRLSRRNKVEDVTKLYSLYCSLVQDFKKLTQKEQDLLQKVESLENTLKDFIGPLNATLAELNKPKQANMAPVTPSYTIEKVLEFMLLLKQASNRDTYQTRKKQTLVKLLNEVGLSLDDDYGKFHNVGMIEQLSKKIINDTSMMNDNKKMKIRYLKELATCGNNINPDLYKAHIINNFPQIENTKKVDKKQIGRAHV